MIEPNIYCKVSGMAMQCIGDFFREFNRKPVVLEIGCADGQGTMRFAGFTEKTICVDPMVGGRPDIPSYSVEKLEPDQTKLNDFKRRTQDFPVELVLGASMWKETISKVREILGDQKVDVLIIDGCHHPFEAVWGDFVAYYELVSKGGYVIFDDLYEGCILEAYEKAAIEHNMVKHDRWAVKNQYILQDTAALKKTED